MFHNSSHHKTDWTLFYHFLKIYTIVIIIMIRLVVLVIHHKNKDTPDELHKCLEENIIIILSVNVNYL